jgi:hypothetical protein
VLWVFLFHACVLLDERFAGRLVKRSVSRSTAGVGRSADEGDQRHAWVKSRFQGVLCQNVPLNRNWVDRNVDKRERSGWVEVMGAVLLDGLSQALK